MSRLLARLGCHASTAENGLIALEQIMATPAPRIRTAKEAPLSVEDAWAEENARFGIVFLDNQMPIMSGLGTIRHLREAGRQDLVVGVTAHFFQIKKNTLTLVLTMFSPNPSRRVALKVCWTLRKTDGSSA